MEMHDFIRINYKRIDREIKGKPPGSVPDDNERELWIREDHDLTCLARQCGVEL